MRRALAEVEKKEVPPSAAPMDIGAPKGVAVQDQQYNDDDNCWAPLAPTAARGGGGPE